MEIKDFDGKLQNGKLITIGDGYSGELDIIDAIGMISIPASTMKGFKTNGGARLIFSCKVTKHIVGTLFSCGYSPDGGGSDWNLVNYAFKIWKTDENKVEVYIKLPNEPVITVASHVGIIDGQPNTFGLFGPKENDEYYYLKINDALYALSNLDKVKKFWSNFGVRNYSEECTFGGSNSINIGRLSGIFYNIKIYDLITKNNKQIIRHSYLFDSKNDDDKILYDRIGIADGTISRGAKVNEPKKFLNKRQTSKEQITLLRLDEKIQKFDYLENLNQSNIDNDNWGVTGIPSGLGDSWDTYGASSKPLNCGEYIVKYTAKVRIICFGLTENLIPKYEKSHNKYGFLIWDDQKTIKMKYNYADGDNITGYVPTIGDEYKLTWEINKPVKFYINNVLKYTFPGNYETPLYPMIAMYTYTPKILFQPKIIQKSRTIQGIRKTNSFISGYLWYNQCYNNSSSTHKVRNLTAFEDYYDMAVSDINMLKLEYIEFNGYNNASVRTSMYFECVNKGKFFTSFTIVRQAQQAQPIGKILQFDWNGLMIFMFGVTATNGVVLESSNNKKHTITGIEILPNIKYTVCICVNNSHVRLAIKSPEKSFFWESFDYVLDSRIPTNFMFGNNSFIGNIRNMKLGNLILSNDEMQSIVTEENLE